MPIYACQIGNTNWIVNTMLCLLLFLALVISYNIQAAEYEEEEKTFVNYPM